MNEDLTQLKKMLAALLKSDGHIHYIGGYAHGRTSQGDPFIILYPQRDDLEKQVCRVYPRSFKKLPAFVDTAVNGAQPSKTAPDKPEAKKRGIYRECPMFCIVTYFGKETQMGRERRFSDVLYQTNGRPPAEEKPEDGLFSWEYGDKAVAIGDEEKTTFRNYMRANDEEPPASKQALRDWYKETLK